ncbi:Uma2 family endonuclease [Echinicola strongylocentroti]|uniref:Uma2 family endonuclease n=1 Tax=Echinicola strongylocentroti TaxID=1795355 RepID=A0A2Z4IM04_9BACT|nr:Uma2 family endonuclease [Echinicola strongylocentroti]AWW31749.1 Uma2 family endonuclease [Echinicola strongylocentroti]
MTKDLKTPETDKNKVAEPDVEYGHYSYADYLTWQMDEMVELIKGKVFKKAAAAPRRIHQKVAVELTKRWAVFLEGKVCEVYSAPFDVRLPQQSKADKDITTVVQPDLCVICDRAKLDDRGCIGAPDLVMEILSPGNNRLELQNKYELYQESGVKEYWIIHPDEQTLLVYTLVKGKYVPSQLMTSGDMVRSKAVEGFELDLEDFFSKIK